MEDWIRTKFFRIFSIHGTRELPVSRACHGSRARPRRDTSSDTEVQNREDVLGERQPREEAVLRRGALGEMAKVEAMMSELCDLFKLCDERAV